MVKLLNLLITSFTYNYADWYVTVVPLYSESIQVNKYISILQYSFYNLASHALDIYYHQNYIASALLYSQLFLDDDYYLSMILT